GRKVLPPTSPKREYGDQLSGGRDADTFIGDDSCGCGITRGDIGARADHRLDGSDLLRLVYPWQLDGRRPDRRNKCIYCTVAPNATVVGTAGATTSQLNVGDAGTGMLTIQSGGTVSSGGTPVGVNAGSQGTVTVTGAGSTWTISNQGINVGQGGTGMLTI